MKAIVADGHGNVELQEVPKAEPAPHEALIAVEAFSINRGETYLLETATAGWQPGKDVAGTVVAKAADGTGPASGTRVVAHVPGAGWAEHVAVETQSLVTLPEHVATSTAAALPLAGLTAVRLLREIGSLIGKRILITGASGGVGHYLTEIAVASGAEVVAVSADHARGGRLRQLGAATLRDVSEATGWYDVALESVGGGSLVAARRRVRPDGQVIWFGQASRQPSTLDFFDWIDGAGGASISHFHYAADAAQDCADLRTLVRLTAEERLHPEVGLSQTWDQTADVIDALRTRQVRGNAVLTLIDRPGTDRTLPVRENRDTRQVLATYLDALVDGDLATIADSFSEDATWWLHGDLPLSGTKHGRDEIIDFLTGAGSLYQPNSQDFTFGEITVECDRAALEWRVTGISAATGIPYDNSYCGVFVVRHGRIVEVREYLDTLHAQIALFGPTDR